MALKKVNPTATPAFEEEEVMTENVNDVVEVEVEAQAQTEPEVKEEPKTEVAVSKAKSLALKGSKLGSAFQNQLNVIDTEALEELGQGTMPKIVADRGGFDVNKKDLGNKLLVELFSYNERLVIAPGVDSEEAKDLVRYSYDGETIAGEDTLVKDYVASLKENGFPRAEAKQYIDLWVTIDEAPEVDELPEEAQDLVQVQLSPSSVREWKAFMLQASFRMARNNEAQTGNPKLRLEVDKREYNGNKFAAIKFYLVK